MKALIIVTPIDAHQCPLLPAPWDASVQIAGEWFSIWIDGQPGPRRLHCWRVKGTAGPMELDGAGVFVEYGDAADLSVVKASALHAYTIGEVRDGIDAEAIAIRDDWLDDRPTGDTGPIVAIRHGLAGVYCAAYAESTKPGDVP